MKVAPPPAPCPISLSLIALMMRGGGAARLLREGRHPPPAPTCRSILGGGSCSRVPELVATPPRPRRFLGSLRGEAGRSVRRLRLLEPPPSFAPLQPPDGSRQSLAGCFQIPGGLSAGAGSDSPRRARTDGSFHAPGDGERFAPGTGSSSSSSSAHPPALLQARFPGGGNVPAWNSESIPRAGGHQSTSRALSTSWPPT